MALLYNGSSQYLHAALSGLARQPVTIAALVRQDGAYGRCTAASLVGSDSEDAEAIQLYNNYPRAISWDPVASAQAAALSDTEDYHSLIGVFGLSQILVSLDGTETTQAYTASSWTPAVAEIGRAGSTYTNLMDGGIEHLAIWDCALSASERAALVNCTSNPANVQPDHLIAYLPLMSSLEDLVGELTWTTEGFSSPSYETSGITYPAASGGSWQQKNGLWLRRNEGGYE